MVLMPSITVEKPEPVTGRFAFVDYGVDSEPWHERFIFEVLENRHCVVITPDEDVYVEVFQVGRGCFRNLRLLPPRSRTVPKGLGISHGQPLYRFPTHIIRASVMAAAQKLFDKEKAKPHLPLEEDGDEEEPDEEEGDEDEETGGDGFDAAAAAAAIRRKGGRWFVTSSNDPDRIGQVASFSDAMDFARFDGDHGYIVDSEDFGMGKLVYALEFVADEAVSKYIQARAKIWQEADKDATPKGEEDDARTLPVQWSANGYRTRPFADASRLMEVSEMDDKDFPLEGPRSLSWLVTAMANGGTTPLTRHGRWIAESGVGADSRSGHEHSILSHILEKAIVVDQLNVVNLVAMEIVGRRIIFLEEAHSVDAGAPSFEGWEHWLGLGERRAGILIPPELSRFVAKRVGDEAAVAKERRKAGEERRMAKNRKKDDPKGKGKGEHQP